MDMFAKNRNLRSIGLVFLLSVIGSIGFSASVEAREVGIAYTTFHNWKKSWGTPLLGQYSADDPTVIEKHAKWLHGAGVDFIFIDWSNDIDYVPGCDCRKDIEALENTTYVIADEYQRLKEHPKIAIMLGFPGEPEAILNGKLQKKADQVYDDFIKNPGRSSIYERYEGRPLLIVYVGTPSPFKRSLPNWDDPRFTVKWLTGFVSQQRNLLSNDQVSKFGYWSWEDRGPQTYTMAKGRPEAMTITASWRPDAKANIAGRTRMGGDTFREAWQRAIDKQVDLALVVSWNEWSISEQKSAEASKDIEPSVEFKDFYLRLLAKEIARFKGAQ
ncbi:hypothetical protein NUV26_11190 [Burkholderia pseudomultivorans]|uniref:hypothetical protein n=1 Tax=Burkholderia pseudomultivorans TaxID=1207504 RepID=UPI0028769DE7|nr:hypothetical protein [Burkholderia pseudomultivorans]MDS0792721.1 hypothetical protein [Burkholderia pseudomultivorans]